MMTRQVFAAARAYIMTHGRPLDQARFAFHFEGGDRAGVVQALAGYQNEDGGFGHALEPDLRTPASSAIATSTGLAILGEVEANGDEPLVIAAVQYLLDSYDASQRVWPIVPPAVEDAPHAPWWAYADSEANFAGFKINPRASLVGRLYHFATGQEAADALLADVSHSLLAHLEATPDDELGMHDLLALLELVEADNVPDDQRRPIVDKLRRAVHLLVATDPHQWPDYNLRPLQVAPAPDALLADEINPSAIEANLDHELANQAADGSWPLTWSWAFVDAAAWAEAERDWKGFHAVNHLRTLAAYGRIAVS